MELRDLVETIHQKFVAQGYPRERVCKELNITEELCKELLPLSNLCKASWDYLRIGRIDRQTAAILAEMTAARQQALLERAASMTSKEFQSYCDTVFIDKEARQSYAKKALSHMARIKGDLATGGSLKRIGEDHGISFPELATYCALDELIEPAKRSFEAGELESTNAILLSRLPSAFQPHFFAAALQMKTSEFAQFLRDYSLLLTTEGP